MDPANDRPAERLARSAFTSDEFDDVKNHLLVEIGHFVTVDQWFGPNGIINAINSQVSMQSAGDLTEAAAMMSIPAPRRARADDRVQVGVAGHLAGR